MVQEVLQIVLRRAQEGQHNDYRADDNHESGGGAVLRLERLQPTLLGGEPVPVQQELQELRRLLRRLRGVVRAPADDAHEGHRNQEAAKGKHEGYNDQGAVDNEHEGHIDHGAANDHGHNDHGAVRLVLGLDRHTRRRGGGAASELENSWCSLAGPCGEPGCRGRRGRASATSYGAGRSRDASRRRGAPALRPNRGGGPQDQRGHEEV
mmetsp:Transcript_19476/g.51542  ORF Transcript_19476/g.51542 Transcript_19476/m.51542 type:complete len:208 (-) Transcript_19476:384-1007(-)